MPSAFGPNEQGVIIRFGGGVHSRASEDEIDPRECATGKNFQLDPDNMAFRNRKPFDFVAQVPNASEIRGFATLLKTDGTVSSLVQAGATVYQWDGGTGFDVVGTVSASARLRGPLSQNWQLDDKVIITDLALAEEIHEWDGTTLTQTTFTTSPSGAFGTFRAKYCVIQDERAIYANVHDNGTNYAHLIVGSQRGDDTIISTANRASSSLGDADPWFLVQPDYRAINGMVSAFNRVITSSMHGSLWRLDGSTSKDYAMTEFFPRSGASGDESVAYIGNDVLYGRPGRIESVIDTDRFGDSEANDLTLKIGDLVESFDDWTIVYNERVQRAYCIAASTSQAWVYHKSLRGSEVSPWALWTTQHSSSFQPTAIMSMLDPSDGLEYVFFGDASGNLYRMEGSGSGDGGSAAIKSERLSAMYKAQLDASAYDVEGWITYRKNVAATGTLTIEYAGESVFNEAIDITIPAITGRPVYGGGLYYSGGSYYGTPFAQRLTRQSFGVAGDGQMFQVRASFEGATDFEILEIGLRFTEARG